MRRPCGTASVFANFYHLNEQSTCSWAHTSTKQISRFMQSPYFERSASCILRRPCLCMLICDVNFTLNSIKLFPSDRPMDGHSQSLRSSEFLNLRYIQSGPESISLCTFIDSLHRTLQFCFADSVIQSLYGTRFAIHVEILVWMLAGRGGIFIDVRHYSKKTRFHWNYNELTAVRLHAERLILVIANWISHFEFAYCAYEWQIKTDLV